MTQNIHVSVSTSEQVLPTGIRSGWEGKAEEETAGTHAQLSLQPVQRCHPEDAEAAMEHSAFPDFADMHKNRPLQTHRIPYPIGSETGLHFSCTRKPPGLSQLNGICLPMDCTTAMPRTHCRVGSVPEGRQLSLLRVLHTDWFYNQFLILLPMAFILETSKFSKLHQVALPS